MYRKIDPSEVDQKSFWSKVDKSGTPEHPDCWIWLASLDMCGYGNFHIKRCGVKAHRVSFMLANPFEDITESYILHSCDNPVCVNPTHLRSGDQFDNMKDMVKRGRHKNGDRKGSRHPLAVLSEEKVRDIREEYSSRKITQLELAKKYKVSQGTIAMAVTRKTWSHVH